jgi:hypothetical protein
VWPDAERAQQAMLGLPKDVLIPGALLSEPEDVPLDDAITGSRLTWVDMAHAAHADYVFRSGRVAAWIRVTGSPEEEAALDFHANQLAIAQLDRIRAVLAMTPLQVSAPPPTPEVLLNGLLVTPFDSSLVPEGLPLPEVRPAPEPTWLLLQDSLPGSSRPPLEPLGAVDVSSNGRASWQRPYLLAYRVYRTAAEAEREFLDTSHFAFRFTPQTVPDPVRCGSGECILVSGNVVVISQARNVNVNVFPFDPNPEPPEAIALVDAGAHHLDAVRTRLTTQRPAAVPAPVQIPRP